MENIIAARRDEVFASYEAAKKTNNRLFLEKDYRATEEYIYPNQKVDANRILSAFYTEHLRVVCVQKKTKVGADGLMIELAKLMATHPDDTFVVNTESIRILTGMSNTGWERDMIEKSPSFLKDKIIHHGRLSKANLQHIRDSLIIIDEIDTGNKEFQVLHKVLWDADLLDVTKLVERNIRFLLISATMMKERYDLYRWDHLHKAFKMTIPPEYVGHDYFLTKGIIKEFSSLNKKEEIQRWIREDILDYYRVPCMCPSCNPTQNPGKQDFRVHIVRGNQKTAPLFQAECERTGILFKNHSSTDRLSAEQIHDIFIKPLTQHIVLCVKGFFRRANLIPNEWKKRIGATHELYTKIVDNNVQIQGLVGRMTGYWRSIMENGHKTGPYRTSIKAMKEYEASYHDPFGANSYQSAGFKKKDGKVTAGSTMLSPKNIKNLVPCDPPQVEVITPAAVPDANPHKTVPILIEGLTPQNIDSLSTSSGEERKQHTLQIIRTHRPDLIDEISQYKFRKINKCTSDYSYKNHITDVIVHVRNNTPYDVDFTPEDKTGNCINVFIDTRENRLIIVRWKGVL